MAKRQLEQKRAIVTGASSGIGRQLAIQLAAAGVDVVVTARREDRLQQLADEIRAADGTCLVVAGDISSADTRRELLMSCVKHLGGLDILINNAGVGAMGRFDEADPDRMRQVFDVNFFAIADLIRDSLSLLKKGRDPIIVNMSSVLAHRAAPLKSEYCASKFALHGFSDSLRAELVCKKIDVLLVSPSTTDSEFFDHAIEDNTRKDWKTRGAMPPAIVAAKTIRAIRKRKHEIILTHGGRFIVWLDRLMPWLADRVVAKYGQ